MRKYLLTKDNSFLEVTMEFPVPEKEETPSVSKPAKKIDGASHESWDFLDAKAHFISATSSEKSDSSAAKPGETKTVHARLPRYTFSFENRKAAAALLTTPSDQFESIDWGFAERTRVKALLTQDLNDVCQCDIEKIETEKIKTPSVENRNAMIRWILENKKILEAIPQ
jgi:hypothetical protein